MLKYDSPKVQRLKNLGIEYDMFGHIFKLKPRTIANIKRVQQIIDSETEDTSQIALRWEMFKAITDGDHEAIEKDFENLFDLDICERAIEDFFSSPSQSLPKVR